MKEITLARITETEVMDAIKLLKDKKMLWLERCVECGKKIKTEDDVHSFNPIGEKVYILCNWLCYVNWCYRIKVWNKCGSPEISKKSLPKFKKYIKKFKKSTQKTKK